MTRKVVGESRKSPEDSVIIENSHMAICNYIYCNRGFSFYHLPIVETNFLIFHYVSQYFCITFTSDTILLEAYVFILRERQKEDLGGVFPFLADSENVTLMDLCF